MREALRSGGDLAGKKKSRAAAGNRTGEQSESPGKRRAGKSKTAEVGKGQRESPGTYDALTN